MKNNKNLSIYLYLLTRQDKNYAQTEGIWTFRSSALLFPGAKSPKRENSRAVVQSLTGSEKSENFRSMELLHPWNFCYLGANVPRTLIPWNFRTCGTFDPQTTFVPFNFCSCRTFAPVLKKVVDSRKAMCP